MTKLYIPDMHCENCVKRISNAFQESNIDCTIDLSLKTVTVDPTKEAESKEILDDLGFEVSEV